jgi:hypothetical protein
MEGEPLLLPCQIFFDARNYVSLMSIWTNKRKAHPKMYIINQNPSRTNDYLAISTIDLEFCAQDIQCFAVEGQEFCAEG